MTIQSGAISATKSSASLWDGAKMVANCGLPVSRWTATTWKLIREGMFSILIIPIVWQKWGSLSRFFLRAIKNSHKSLSINDFRFAGAPSPKSLTVKGLGGFSELFLMGRLQAFKSPLRFFSVKCVFYNLCPLLEPI